MFCLALCKKTATISCLCIFINTSGKEFFMKTHSIYARITTLTGAFFIILTLSMTMLKTDAISPDKSLLDSVKSLNLLCFLLFFIFYGFLLRTFSLLKQESRKGIFCCLVPAFLFSVFMIVGRSYYLENDWNLVFGSKLMTVKTLIQMVGYVFLFGSCLAALYEKLDHTSIRTGSGSGLPKPLQFWKRQLYAHPLVTTFLTLLVFYLPYIIYSFPGIIYTDTVAQLDNGYSALAGEIRLKNHHPVIHTLMLRFFSWIGEIFFSSASIGLGIMAICQICFLFFAIAWLTRYLVRKNISAKAIGFLFLFYIAAPRIRNYMFLMGKDTWFAGFLLLFLVQLFEVLEKTPCTGKETIRRNLLLIFASAGIFFFRQEGAYILMLTGIAFFIFTRRKAFLCMTVCAFALSLVYLQVVLPGFSVKPSNPREMFSIPFQQTARYLRDAGDDVTDSEKEAIAAILDYDHLAERYNPNLSDPVKATYNTDAPKNLIVNYLRNAWLPMLIRHPDIYIQATLNNLYGYFYPDGYSTMLYSYDHSAEKMAEINTILERFHTDYHYPAAFDHIRTQTEDLREKIFYLPVLSAFNLTAFYIWALITWIFYCIRRSYRQALQILFPLLVLVLVFIAGPAYGWYFRYAYSIAFCLPAVILLGWSRNRQSSL